MMQVVIYILVTILLPQPKLFFLVLEERADPGHN